jgi:hypothetical protein
MFLRNPPLAIYLAVANDRTHPHIGFLVPGARLVAAPAARIPFKVETLYARARGPWGTLLVRAQR